MYFKVSMTSKLTKNFYFLHTENKCSVFCICCNKIAYSTKENKYLNSVECYGHNNLQCLNSCCANGFSKTYHNNFIADNRSDFLKRQGEKISTRCLIFLPTYSTNYMSRYQLN